MKELPILINVEMVRAVLEGRKTQTRRIAKLTENGMLVLRGRHATPIKNGVVMWTPVGGEPELPMPPSKISEFCPHGRIGQKLWVRENFQLMIGGMTDSGKEWDIYDGELNPGWTTDEHRLHPRDREFLKLYAATEKDTRVDCWRPSIHMPRWASRINLEITGVRVERLWDISGDDVVAEGVKCLPKEGTITWESDTRSRMAKMWNDIQGDGAWEKSNPWVWAITFKRVK